MFSGGVLCNKRLIARRHRVLAEAPAGVPSAHVQQQGACQHMLLSVEESKNDDAFSKRKEGICARGLPVHSGALYSLRLQKCFQLALLLPTKPPQQIKRGAMSAWLRMQNPPTREHCPRFCACGQGGREKKTAAKTVSTPSLGSGHSCARVCARLGFAVDSSATAAACARRAPLFIFLRTKTIKLDAAN